jgi:hypothetical protein
MLLFNFSFLPKHGDLESLVESAEEVADSWEWGSEGRSEKTARTIADQIANDVCIPTLGYDETDKKVYRNTLFHGLRSRKDD